MERLAASRMRGVVVRDAAGVALALRAARGRGLHGPLPLLSPPGAASWLGAPLFLALIRAGGAAPPGLEPPLEPPPEPWPEPWPVLDCGQAPGHALAALRAGVAAVVLAPECPAFPTLAALAPGRVLAAAPPALDLAHGTAGRPATEEQVARWLAADPARSAGPAAGGSGPGDSPEALG
ncbi:hypothetical protein [Teichococcus aestuarii]|nr:hypothetical protein [Pseudoroseomonas aestuarii]